MRAQRRARSSKAALVSCLFIGFTAIFTSPAVLAQSPQQPGSEKSEGKADPKAAEAQTGVVPASTTTNGTSQGANGVNGSVAGSAATAKTGSVSSGPGIPVEDRPLIGHTDLVTVTVTVTDMYGRFVTGLGKNAFSVFDEKSQQDILFFSDEDAPVSLGVVFDVSGSMSGDKISKAREALSRFVDTSHNRDEYFLIGFNQRAQLLLNRTRDSDALLDKLTFVQTKGNTALYDATYLGVERVTRGTHPKRAILLISDGQDNSSRYTFSEVKRMLKESDVIIYAIGIVGGGGSDLDMQGRAILEELSGVSGGKAFFPSSTAEMNDTFERIALELRTQYSISYKPSNFTNDGKWHKIKVKVQPPRGFPRLFVRGREGYYAVTNPK